MFSQLWWNIYVLGQKDINIKGIWKVSDRKDANILEFVILVNDILAILDDQKWMYELGQIKSSHFTQEDNKNHLSIRYCAIYEKHELVYLNFYDSELILKKQHPYLELVLHKDQKMTEIPFLSSQAFKTRRLTLTEFSEIEDTFYLTCYRIGRLLRKKEIWQAKVIEHQRLRSCFQQLYYFLPDNETIDGRDLNQEIKECLSNFQVNTTWERLFYYIRIFELMSDYLCRHHFVEINYHAIKVIKNCLYEMYHCEQQEKRLT